MKHLMYSVAMLTAIVLFSFLLNGCASEIDSEKVDEHQRISRDNAHANAKAYGRAVHGGFENIIGDSDSSIGPGCAFGDGWASVTLTDNNGEDHRLKCQTNGSGKGNRGCLTVEAFAQKAFADQEGKCDGSIKRLVKQGG